MNISRETRKQNRNWRVIKKPCGKCPEMLAEIAEKRDDYKKRQEHPSKKFDPRGLHKQG